MESLFGNAMRHIEFNLPDFELVMEAFSSMSIVPPSSLKEKKVMLCSWSVKRCTLLCRHNGMQVRMHAKKAFTLTVLIRSPIRGAARNVRDARDAPDGRFRFAPGLGYVLAIE